MQPKIEVEGVTAREKEYIDLLQRTRADFINYKNRVQQERDEQSKFATAELILKLLPVLDDFSRAQEVVPEEMAEANWVKGIELIKRNLKKVLEGEGLTKIEAQGNDFNPREHEAVSYEESNTYEEGKVKAIFKDGYRLNGRVIRPAQVAVSKGKNNKRANIAIKRKQERRI